MKIQGGVELNFRIVKLDYKYCDYLRDFDYRIAHNRGSKELRPYIGILFIINDLEYFAPLSSPKEKYKTMHNSIDLIKIKNGEYGVINLNNMLPVHPNNYEVIDLNSPKNDSEIKRYNLIKKQLRWLNSNRNIIYDNAINLYKLYINNKLPRRIKNRCCNFLLLEQKSVLYNDSLVSV